MLTKNAFGNTLHSTNLADRWISYYSTSLKDGDNLDLKYYTFKDKACFLDSLNNLFDTSKAADIYQNLLKDKYNSTTSIETKTDGIELLNVLVAPFYISQSMNRFYPFWIPLCIDNYGKLYVPENESLPWFQRSMLEPNIMSNNNYPFVADVSDVSNKLNRFNFNWENFESYWASCEGFFREVVGANYAHFKISDFDVVNEPCILSGQDSIVAVHVLHVYKALKKTFKYPKLLGELLNNQFRIQENLPNVDTLFSTFGHYGQYSNKFPLSYSQRQSILTFIGEENSFSTNVLAVNGPPGTGKTTLLQSVIANEMVVGALKKQAPKRLIACSANNQAITNILESFASLKSLQRWIPNIHSFGTYLISSDQDKQAEALSKGYQIMHLPNQRGRGLHGYYFEELEAEHTSMDYVSDFYIHKYTEIESCSKTMCVKDIVKDLHCKLIETTSQIDGILSVCKRALACEELHGGMPDLVNIEGQLTDLKTELDNLERERNQLIDYKENKFDPFFESNKLGFIAKLISSKKQEYSNTVKLFLATSPYAELVNQESKDAAELALIQLLKSIHDKIELKNKEIARVDQLLVELKSLMNDKADKLTFLDSCWEQFLSRKNDKTVLVLQRIIDDGTSWIEKVNLKLDLTLRYQSFELAVHYWEGRWIIDQVENDKKTNTKGEKSRIDVFRRISFLTPLFVSTFHSLPSFCSSSFKKDEIWQSKPIQELFDVLIVDEAGQVTPEISVPSFVFAKRALIVGDTHQIEPVWKIVYDRIDKANLEANNLLEKYSFEELDDRGVLCHSGSLMKMAQNASRTKVSDKIGGTMLVEHRRCADELVEFSNEFVYGGLLKPLVGRLVANDFNDGKKKISLTPLAYLNINSCSMKRSGSLCNEKEAEGIAKWLSTYGNTIRKFYSRKDYIPELKDCIAIVTPFKAQTNTIKSQLKLFGVDKNIIVGTVHSLQGAEIPIVIFSPTYGLNDRNKRFFFDGGFNMLNVALTRAKHHFIVMGYMGLFNPTAQNKPSGALAKCLFNSPDNEMSSSFLFDDTNIHAFSDRRVSNLSKHQSCLSRAFEVATKRILIVSPFISIQAIEHDGLLAKIQTVVSKNVEVLVYTDSFLDIMSNGKLKEHSRVGREKLVEAGARLTLIEGVHNKALAIDSDTLIEGSFNWLSAVRDENSKYFRHEVSQIILGDEANIQINQLLDELSQAQN